MSHDTDDSETPDQDPADPLEATPRLDPELDRLFSESVWPKPFEFNDRVARVFDDMASRSIPLYRDVIETSTYWCQRFYRPDTWVIDIGCSTGTQLELIRRVLRPAPAVFGVDRSEAMIERAREKLGGSEETEEDLAPDPGAVRLVAGDATAVEYPPASVVIVNYTLQFLPVSDRLRLLQALHAALVPGGLLVVSEKVRSETAEFQEVITHRYERFKQQQGYSEMEIARKKEALENVLVSLTHDQQVDALRRAGFRAVETILRWHPFETLVALK